MDIVNQIGDLVGKIGLPGALLMMFSYGAIKSGPKVFAFLESVKQSLETIALSMVEMKKDIEELREDVKDLRGDLLREQLPPVIKAA